MTRTSTLGRLVKAIVIDWDFGRQVFISCSMNWRHEAKVTENCKQAVGAGLGFRENRQLYVRCRGGTSPCMIAGVRFGIRWGVFVDRSGFANALGVARCAFANAA